MDEPLVDRLRRAARKMIAEDGPDSEWKPEELTYSEAADEIERLQSKLEEYRKADDAGLEREVALLEKVKDLESRLDAARDLLHEAVGRLGPDLGGRVLGFLMGAVERQRQFDCPGSPLKMSKPNPSE